MFVECIKILKSVYISGMMITDFKRNIVHLNGNAKKNHERLTENTVEVKKTSKLKYINFDYDVLRT